MDHSFTGRALRWASGRALRWAVRGAAASLFCALTVPGTDGRAADGSTSARPCGMDEPCAVTGGDYYLSYPDDWDGESPLPAIVFFHGHNSSGQSAMKSQTIKRVFVDNGYLLIAPNGEKMQGRNTRRWPARPVAAGEWRDDVAFTMDVMEDVANRVPLEADHVLVSGFSAGGSMAWMMACYEGDNFAGFASVAGALRRPVPQEVCPAGPVRMMQIHGFADNQVPFEGRGIGDWHQGDVFESLAILRETNECQTNPTAINLDDEFWCRIWQGCASHRDIQFCMHDGGHGLPAGWAEITREWFEGAQDS